MNSLARETEQAQSALVSNSIHENRAEKATHMKLQLYEKIN